MPRRTEIDLAAAGLVSGFAAAALRGAHRELLAPLRYLESGALPSGEAPRVDRAALAHGLGVANASYGHPEAAPLAAKLARPETRVVVAGQQSGLFGGPLLALTKAVAAIRYAEALEEAGRPAVAVFWMATEDHDFREIAAASFLEADRLLELSLGEDPSPLAPVALRTIGATVEPLLAELATRFSTDRFRAHLETLGRLYRPEARFGEAFARLFVCLLGARAPLFLDAMLPEVKEAERPHLAAIVRRREEIDRALAERGAAMRAAGFEPQVREAPGASPLFFVAGLERRRIEWRGEDRFTLRGAEGERPVSVLEAAIAENPAAVGPGALARPAIQDAILGTTLQVLGPAELAYMTQAAALHAVLGIAPPWATLRPQAILVDGKQREHAAELGIDFQALLTAPDEVEQRLGERSGGAFVGVEREAIAARIAALRAPALAVDAGLERPFEKTRETVERALDLFAEKVAAAAMRRDETRRRRFAALRASILPGGRLQDRVLSIAYFAGRYGEAELARTLLDGIALDPRQLQLLDPSAPSSPS